MPMLATDSTNLRDLHTARVDGLSGSRNKVFISGAEARLVRWKATSPQQRRAVALP